MQHHPGDEERTCVSIYVSALSGLDTALQLANEFQRRDCNPTLALDSEIGSQAKEIVRSEGCDWYVIEPMTRTEEQRARLHRLVVNMFTSFVPGDNSHYRTIGRLGGPSSRLKRMALYAIRRLPFMPGARAWNWAGNHLFRSLVAPRFRTDWVIAISMPLNPLLLCSGKIHVDTVMDSWDHPLRKVVGYRTRCVMGWNADLVRDWRTFQGADREYSTPPRRLYYALERSPREPLDRISGAKPCVLYPVATSSIVRESFADELRLIRTVHDACADADARLLIKPRPEELPSSLVRLVDALPFADLGESLNMQGGALEYRLTDDYNRARLEELDSADVVISTVTTFGLDAGAAGRPVQQLDLRSVVDLPHLAAAAHNYHLRRYLYDLPATLTPTSTLALREQLGLALDQDQRGQQQRASSAIRDWLESGSSALEDVVETLLTDHRLLLDGRMLPGA